jgi:hypothetical protein
MDKAWLKKFSTYDGKKLAPTKLVKELMAKDGLKLGALLGQKARETVMLFDNSADDEDLPASHECSITVDGGRVTNIEYRVRYEMEGDNGGLLGVYKKHGSDAFAALAKALVTAYGKPSFNKPKHKQWTLADRELDMHVTSCSGGRPYCVVQLNITATSPAAQTASSSSSTSLAPATS